MLSRRFIWCVGTSPPQNCALLRSHGALRAVPIVLAAFSNRTEIVSILVKHGASLNSIGSAGQTALMTAAEHGRTDIVDILSAAGADMTIHAATALGLTNEVERILSESRAWLEAKKPSENPCCGLHLKRRTHRAIFRFHDKI